MIRYSSWALVLVLLLCSCSGPDPATTASTLRIAVLPDQSAEILRAEYASLSQYLADATGVGTTLIIPDDYPHLVNLFGSGEADLAFFGGVTFVLAEARHGARPLVSRDIDVDFRSYLIARPEDADAMLGDFEARTLAFGSQLSTSGHFMPRFFLRELGITPEEFFSAITYTGTHDATIAQVQAGDVDLGAVNSQIFDAYLDNSESDDTSPVVIWESPPYTDYVWAVSSTMDEYLVDTLQDAFLRLAPGPSGGDTILQAMGASGFLPVATSDFDALREIVLEESFLPAEFSQNLR